MNLVLPVLSAILFDRNQFAILRSSSLTHNVSSLRLNPLAKQVVSSERNGKQTCGAVQSGFEGGLRYARAI
jgi:hypothetical protein